MTPLATFFLLLGLALGVILISRWRDWPRSRLFTRKQVKPEDVRISPEAIQRQQERERFAFESMKTLNRPKGFKANQQKANWR